MSPAVITLCVLAVAAFFFVTELIPLAVTAIGASIALGLLGVLTPQQVFSGLSDSTVVLFAGMFVIGAAMFQTGLAQKIGIKVVKSAGTSENRLMAALMCITILLSAVSSNTATVACLMPVVIQICAVAKIPVSGDFAVEMIKRGDIFGSSFAYALNEKDKTKVSYSMKDGLLLRTVHMIDRISDISPVVDPAFYGTDVTVRSMDDTIAELSGENKDYLNELNNLRKSI